LNLDVNKKLLLFKNNRYCNENGKIKNLEIKFAIFKMFQLPFNKTPSIGFSKEKPKKDHQNLNISYTFTSKNILGKSLFFFKILRKKT
jgi:hypothetical protein